jgi:hypothetical protein
MGVMRLSGRARDFVTLRGHAEVVAEDRLEAVLRPSRAIESISAEPARAALTSLVGERAGGGLRRALNAQLADERRRGAPLFLLLDDLAGASLVAGAAWPQWDKDSPPAEGVAMTDDQTEALLQGLIGVCIGHAQGSSANELDGVRRDYGEALAADLARPEDVDSWHALTVTAGPGLRRARRIDLTLDDDVIRIDAEFQDSAAKPDGRRAAIHEYGLQVTAHLSRLEVLAIAAQPRVLPYPECPAATAGLSRLVGAKLAELRDSVPVVFAGEAGCTHLNDALRALAEVPVLLQRLEATSDRRRTATETYPWDH